MRSTRKQIDKNSNQSFEVSGDLDEKQNSTDSCPFQPADEFQSSSKAAKARTSISQTAGPEQRGWIKIY